MNVSRETMLKQRDLTRTLKVPQPWWVCEGVPGRLPCPASRASACCRAARAPSRAARQTPFSSTYSCVIDPAARVSARGAGLGRLVPDSARAERRAPSALIPLGAQAGVELGEVAKPGAPQA